MYAIDLTMRFNEISAERTGFLYNIMDELIQILNFKEQFRYITNSYGTPAGFISDYFFSYDRVDLEKWLSIKILLTSMRAKFIDYCRPPRSWRQSPPFSLFLPSLIYAFKFRDVRFYWLVNNGYYARRRVPRLRTPSDVIQSSKGTARGVTAQRNIMMMMPARARKLVILPLVFFCHCSRILREFYANILLSIINNRVIPIIFTSNVSQSFSMQTNVLIY